MNTRLAARSQGRSDAERGGALVLSLIAVMVVAVLGMTYMQLARAATREQQASTDVKRAFYMAEAGLAEAFGGLSIGKSGNVGTEAAPAVFGDGLFWVEAEATSEDQVRLESTGMIGSGVATLSIVAERGGVGIASLGTFSSKRIDIPAGSLIDSYDSREGSYASQQPVESPGGGAAQGGNPNAGGGGNGNNAPVAAAADGRVGSNAEISIAGTIQAPTVVRGNVTTGPEHDLELAAYVTIEGETSAAYQPFELPPVTAPEVELDPGVTHDSEAPLVLVSGTNGKESLTVGEGSEVVLVGPGSFVFGSLSLADGASLTFDTTAGGIDLYLMDGLDLAPGSAVSTSGTDPSQLTVQVVNETDDPVRLEAEGELFGVVYAPEAQVTLGAGLQVYGSLVADELLFSGPASLHFDVYLDEVASESALPAFVSWRIVDLATVSTGQGGSDPFRRLGLDPAALPSPGAAHADQELVLEYLDANGTLQTYDGPESAFDWTDVDTVLAGSRDGEPIWVPGRQETALAVDPPPPLPLTDQELIDLVNGTPAMNPAELRQELIAQSPLTEGVLLELVQTNPLDPGNTMQVLLANVPLSDAVLLDLDQPWISSPDRRDALVASSPLSPDVLLEVTLGNLGLLPPDLQAVLNAQ